MANTPVTMFRGLERNLPDEKTDGALYVCTDTRNVYMDNGTTRLLLNDTDGGTGFDDISEMFSFYGLDNMIAHNTFFRGKELEPGGLHTFFTPEELTSVRDGTFTNLFVGDYKIVNDYKYTIAGFSRYTCYVLWEMDVSLNAENPDYNDSIRRRQCENLHSTLTDAVPMPMPIPLFRNGDGVITLLEDVRAVVLDPMDMRIYDSYGESSRIPMYGIPIPIFSNVYYDNVFDFNKLYVGRSTDWSSTKFINAIKGLKTVSNTADGYLACIGAVGIRMP